MFRTRPIEAVEEELLGKEEVQANIVVFIALCAVIRLAPFVLRNT
ncbi:uncharacterized protein Dwil_GK27919 [Drosophila willistoni]|uniref:Uncharacterized protein n=1 Tax=Drosophila willistoni TaxID=7260 RepID=A0A0Q9X168_DROWI|nr:uncharacterized protein LOC26529921 [Drosophila willistoni]KRF99267.1 uncharacterized protein Dwil_GK27919 [Drosophila willistoni]